MNKRIEIKYPEEATPYIPSSQCKFVKIDNLGETVTISDIDGGTPYSPLFKFTSLEYGECGGLSNPLSLRAYGYFRIALPQMPGVEPFIGYCSNERVIATIVNAINQSKETHRMLGEHKLLSPEETERIYAETNIPRYTLV